MEEKIKNWIREILKIDEDLVLVHPKDLKNGDYTFISSSKNPEADAETLRQAQGDLRRQIERIEVVGRFINFYLSRKFFADTIEEILNQGENAGRNKVLAGKKIMVEYTDPNPFKPFHTAGAECPGSMHVTPLCKVHNRGVRHRLIPTLLFLRHTAIFDNR